MTVSELRIRSLPNINSEILGMAEKDKEYAVYEVVWDFEDKWLRIGNNEWISGSIKYVKLKYNPEYTVGDFKISDYLGIWRVLFSGRDKLNLVDEFFDNGYWMEWNDIFNNGQKPSDDYPSQWKVDADTWDIEEGRFVMHSIDYINPPYYTSHEWNIYSAPDDLESLKEVTSIEQLHPYVGGATPLLVSDDLYFLVKVYY